MDDVKKKLLIVDDSEIDRTILHNILQDDFDLIEMNSGKEALEFLKTEIRSISAILLDISMPVMDGFTVLQLMKQRNIKDMPVFMVTAEATKKNVEKAMKYNVVEFIRKPFEKDEIIRRIKIKLNMPVQQDGYDSDQVQIFDRSILTMAVSSEDIAETRQYIAKIKKVYKEYLKNTGKNYRHYQRIGGLMQILLSQYAISKKDIYMSREKIDIISSAASFCDIGYMALPDKKQEENSSGDVSDIYKNHTYLGASMMKWNMSKSCEYFVQICADMCRHHHEKYDGSGFPDCLLESQNAEYTQMCGLLSEFDQHFSQYEEHSAEQFDSLIEELAPGNGGVDPEIFAMFVASKSNVLMYYDIESKY